MLLVLHILELLGQRLVDVKLLLPSSLLFEGILDLLDDVAGDRVEMLVDDHLQLSDTSHQNLLELKNLPQGHPVDVADLDKTLVHEVVFDLLFRLIYLWNLLGEPE